MRFCNWLQLALLAVGFWSTSLVAADLEKYLGCLNTINRANPITFLQDPKGRPIVMDEDSESYADTLHNPELGAARIVENQPNLLEQSAGNTDNLMVIIRLYHDFALRRDGYPTELLALTKDGAYHFSLPQSAQFSGYFENENDQSHEYYGQTYLLHIQSPDGKVDSYVSLSTWEENEKGNHSLRSTPLKYAGDIAVGGAIYWYNGSALDLNQAQTVMISPVSDSITLQRVYDFNVARAFYGFYRHAKVNSLKNLAETGLFGSVSTNKKIKDQVSAIASRRIAALNALSDGKASLSWYSHLSYYVDGPSARYEMEANRAKVFAKTDKELAVLQEQDIADRRAQALAMLKKRSDSLTSETKMIQTACQGLSGVLSFADLPLDKWIEEKSNEIYGMMDPSLIPDNAEGLPKLNIPVTELLVLGFGLEHVKNFMISGLPLWWQVNPK